MPIKVRCSCGSELILKSQLAGKKIRCPDCAEVIRIPSRKKPASQRRKPPRRKPDPWEMDGDSTQPNYSQQSYYIPQPQAPPRQRKKSSRQSQRQIMMFAGIGIGVVFLGCAALLVVYGLKNRVRLDTAENERARIQREVGLGKLDGRTYTNDYFKLKITIPGNYYILDQAERDLLDRELLRDEGIVKGSIEDSVAAREQILLIAVRDIEDESKEEHPAITIGVVRFGNISSLNSPRKYLETIRESDSSYKGRETIRVGESLGSLKASTMTSTEMDSGVLETTKIYVAHVKDYLLAVAIVYTTEADGRELERLVRSIQASQ